VAPPGHGFGEERSTRLTEGGFEQGACPRVWLSARTSPQALRTYNAPKIRFYATLGYEPEVELALV
jgi:hypothetical protein